MTIGSAVSFGLEGANGRPVSINNNHSSQVIIANGGGNVGIGTTGPNSKLQIKVGTDQNIGFNSHSSVARISSYNDAFTASSPLKINGSDLRFDISSVEKMRINASGNVGIGTTNPYNKTHIRTSVDGDGLLLDCDNGNNNKYVGVFFKVDNNTSDAYKKGALVWERTGGYNEGRFHFLLNNDDNVSNVDLTDSKVTILSSGNVGIGTTSPGAKLHIQHGGGAGSGLYVKSNVNRSKITVADNDSAAYVVAEGGKASYGTADSLSANNLTIETSGNVGIGTTSPGEKLEVDGQVLSDGYRLAAMQTAPATRNSTGTLGEIVIDGNHIYVCYATDSWSRVALDTSW